VITFYKDTASIGTGTTTNGVASLTTSISNAGTYTIKARYAGDVFHQPSSGTVKQVVDRYPSTTTFTSIPNPSIFGQAVTLTATVSSGAPTGPTGTVTFKNGSTMLGSATLSSGTATLATTKLPVGSDSLTATYNGDTVNAKGTSSPYTMTVNQATITMTLTSTPNPSSSGQSVKFTATLTSNGSLPNGQTVTFTYNNGTPLGTANVVAGKASLSTAALPTGSDVVTATYAGDADCSLAFASITQTVN
jgi:hypothetical protein